MKKYLIMSLFTALCTLFGCSTAVGFKSVNAKEFAAEIAKPEVQLVDVRTADEYSSGHIKGAVNIDVLGDDFQKLLQEKLDKERPVAIYCRSGRRSKKAAQTAEQLGFSVVELDGGILSWDGEIE